MMMVLYTVDLWVTQVPLIPGLAVHILLMVRAKGQGPRLHEAWLSLAHCHLCLPTICQL
jgi:hypothetical protein